MYPTRDVSQRVRPLTGCAKAQRHLQQRRLSRAVRAAHRHAVAAQLQRQPAEQRALTGLRRHGLTADHRRRRRLGQTRQHQLQRQRDGQRAARGLGRVAGGADSGLLQDRAFALALLLVAALVVQLDARRTALQLADAADVLLALATPPHGRVVLLPGDQAVELAEVAAFDCPRARAPARPAGRRRIPSRGDSPTRPRRRTGRRRAAPGGRGTRPAGHRATARPSPPARP